MAEILESIHGRTFGISSADELVINRADGTQFVLAGGLSRALADALPGIVTTNSSAATRAYARLRERDEENAFPARYFDPDAADDTGDGSPGDPFKLVTAARMLPGYRHLIKAGSTITPGADAVWLLIPATGTAAAPIIIGRYGTGANPIINGAAATKVIRGASGAKFWRVRDLEVIGGGAGTTRFAISQVPVGDAEVTAQEQYNIVIERCKIHGVTSDGVANTNNAINLYGGYNEIRDNEIFDISDDGVWYHGWHALIEGNHIYLCSVAGLASGDNIQAGANSSYSIVRGNTCDHRNADSKQCIYFEPTNSVSTGVVIEDNICYGFDGAAGAMVPIVNGSINGITRRNYVTGGAQGIIISGAGGVAYLNFVNATAGVALVAGSSDCKFYNNTAVQTGAQTGQGTSGSIGLRAGSTTLGGNFASGNLFIGFTYGMLTATVAATGAPSLTENRNAFKTITNNYWWGSSQRTTLAVTADPLLDANYRPAANSPLFGSGPDAPIVPIDKDQRPYPAGLRGIGCYLARAA